MYPSDLFSTLTWLEFLLQVLETYFELYLKPASQEIFCVRPSQKVYFLFPCCTSFTDLQAFDP